MIVNSQRKRQMTGTDKVLKRRAVEVAIPRYLVRELNVLDSETQAPQRRAGRWPCTSSEKARGLMSMSMSMSIGLVTRGVSGIASHLFQSLDGHD